MPRFLRIVLVAVPVFALLSLGSLFWLRAYSDFFPRVTPAQTECTYQSVEDAPANEWCELVVRQKIKSQSMYGTFIPVEYEVIYRLTDTGMFSARVITHSEQPAHESFQETTVAVAVARDVLNRLRATDPAGHGTRYLSTAEREGVNVSCIPLWGSMTRIVRWQLDERRGEITELPAREMCLLGNPLPENAMTPAVRALTMEIERLLQEMRAAGCEWPLPGMLTETQTLIPAGPEEWVEWNGLRIYSNGTVRGNTIITPPAVVSRSALPRLLTNYWLPVDGNYHGLRPRIPAARAQAAFARLHTLGFERLPGVLVDPLPKKHYRRFLLRWQLHGTAGETLTLLGYPLDYPRHYIRDYQDGQITDPRMVAVMELCQAAVRPE